MKKEIRNFAIPAAGLFLVLVVALLRQPVIVYMHYSTWRFMFTAALVFTAASFVFACVRAVSYAVRHRAVPLPPPVQETRRFTEKPEIVDYISHMSDSRPELKARTDRLLSQISRLDALSDKVNMLIEANDLQLFSEAGSLIGGVDGYILQNCRKVINNDIVSIDTPDVQLAAMDVLIRDNEDKIAPVVEFIDKLRDYANAQSGSDSDAVETLKVYTDTIRKSIGQ